ncbi:MAG: hypothetical protein NVS4B2_22000 [Chloroflexota bacterium]
MDAVEEIKGRLSIEDIVGRYVDLKRSGASYKGLCPFHQEKTPSFYVTPARGSYHCFGCGKGGDIFSFVMDVDRVAFPDALKSLAEQAGVSLPERSAEKPSLKNKLYEANEAASRYFADTLRGNAGAPARRYLHERGFGADAIVAFDLGFATESRVALTHHLRSAGFDDRIVLTAGLVGQDEKTQDIFDRFRNRLIFPIRDAAGKILGFGGRTLGDAQPKYLNSPQTEIFDKSSVLFGVHRARDAIRAAGKAVLVEGYLDAVRAHLAGYANVVASLGTAVTSQQLMGLSRLTDVVILALDPDAAGQAAAARTSVDALTSVTQARGRTMGSASTLDLRIAELPAEGGDPDELIRDAPQTWPAVVDASIPAFEYFYLRTMATVDRESDSWRQQAIDRLLPVIASFAGSIGWQAEWLERLARDTGTDVRALQRSLPAPDGRQAGGAARGNRVPDRKRAGEASREIIGTSTARALATDQKIQAEESLISLLLRLVVVPDEAAQLLHDWPFNVPEHDVIVRALLHWAEKQNYDYEIFRETLPASVHDHADRLRAIEHPLPADGKISLAVAYHLARLYLLRLESEMNRTTQLLEDVAHEDRSLATANLGKLMEERRETEQALNRLSQQVAQAGTGVLSP